MRSGNQVHGWLDESFVMIRECGLSVAKFSDFPSEVRNLDFYVNFADFCFMLPNFKILQSE